jgi:dephospho-CoA kinase
VQRARLKTRAALSDEQIEQRLAAQMPVEEKVKHGDFVIDTSTDLETTRRQVEAINSKLLGLAANT